MSKKNGSKEKPLDAKQDKVQAKYIFTSDELMTPGDCQAELFAQQRADEAEGKEPFNAVIKEGGAA